MNRSKWMLAGIALALMAGSGALLGRLQAHQKLGLPGLKSTPLPGGLCRLVLLPEQVLDWQSKWIETDAITTNTLPRDTSYGQRLYTAPDGFQLSLNTVMMGTDRTSIHKPQFCLTGQGWHIDRTEREVVPIARPYPYDLPVVKLTCSKDIEQEGQRVPYRGLYVYWFVADHAISGDPSGFERMWWMARELLTHGELQRWAYVSCFSVCHPGQEAAAYERMKAFIAASVPEFQLASGAPTGARPQTGHPR
jgi:hypothetical protein